MGINFGIRAINTGVNSDAPVVDEVGQVESGGEGFVKSLELIIAGKVKNSILVVRNEFR